MAEPLIIVGAGGHGRETAFAQILAQGERSFLGFLDDRATGKTPEGWPVLGPIDSAPEHRRAQFLVAINDPRSRRAIVQRLEALGVSNWGFVVHPDVRRHISVSVGAGCSILGGCHVTTHIRLGDHCILNRGSHVSHDCVVGDFCSLNPAACVAGNVTVGDGSELGSACAVRQGVTIGAGATIGMGAIVLNHVDANAVMVGNPARLLRSNVVW